MFLIDIVLLFLFFYGDEWMYVFGIRALLTSFCVLRLLCLCKKNKNKKTKGANDEVCEDSSSGSDKEKPVASDEKKNEKKHCVKRFFRAFEERNSQFLICF